MIYPLGTCRIDEASAHRTGPVPDLSKASFQDVRCSDLRPAFFGIVIDPVQEEVLILVLSWLGPVLLELLVSILDDGRNSLRAYRPTSELFGDRLQLVSTDAI